MANRRRVMDRARQLMIQKYGEEETNLATTTNLLHIPWKVLFSLANISDPPDVTGRRDFHVVGEGFGLTSDEIIAIHARKRESSVTMAIFETASKNGKTFMDLLLIWLGHEIDGLNRIVLSWPETLQRKRRSELRHCSPRASYLTPVQTSWDCPSTRQSNQRFRSRRNNIPDEHHSRLHRQPDNLNDDDIESIVSQSTNVSDENNLSACIVPYRPVTQNRPNMKRSNISNRVLPSPCQRLCESGSNPREGGNIPTFIQQNISLGDDDPRSSQRQITDRPENPFEDHDLYSAGPSYRFMEDPTSRFASVTAGPEPTFDHQVHNSTAASPHRLEHQIVDHQVHNSKRASPPCLEHQIVDQPLQDGAHCLQCCKNNHCLQWCKNNPLTLEEQRKQFGEYLHPPSTVAPTEPEAQVNDVQVFICGDDNEKNRTIADKLAANFSHKGVSFVTDEPSGVKGFSCFSQEDRQRIPGDPDKFIEEVFKRAKFVLLLKSEGFMKYISVTSRSKDASVRKHQERLCNIFSWIDAEQRGKNGTAGRLLLLETERQLPPKFFSKLYDCFFKRNED